jgi:hypothetical protein
MYPLLRDGDVLLVRPLDGQSVNIGDAVLCSIAPGRIVVHRVVRKLAGPSGYDFLVQGDHVMRPDGVISHKQVYGRVASIERDGAHINVNNPVMRILSGFAVLRSLWSVGRTRKLPLTLRLIKRLPGLSSYLA